MSKQPAEARESYVRYDMRGQTIHTLQYVELESSRITLSTCIPVKSRKRDCTEDLCLEDGYCGHPRKREYGIIRLRLDENTFYSSQQNLNSIPCERTGQRTFSGAWHVCQSILTIVTTVPSWRTCFAGTSSYCPSLGSMMRHVAQ